MKIVYCLAGTYNSGGMERIVIAKANYLAQKGYEVYIVTTEQKGKVPFFKIDSSITTIDLGINYSDDNNSNFVLKSVKYIYKKHLHKKRISILLGKITPDICISTFGNEVSFLHKIHNNSKKIVEIHFSKFFRTQSARKGIWKIVDIIRSKQDELIIKKYDKFVVLTNEDKGYWKDVNNITVIPNFINVSDKYRSDLTNKICIAVGRLTYQKGFDRLLEIWKIVKEELPDWKLNIYGSGELYSEIETLINKYNLKNNVLINSPKLDICEAYKESSLYILTSHYEGLPMVLLEAFSCGLPAISFDCKCGPKDLIENGVNGYIIKDGDIKEFAKEIVKVLKDNNLRNYLGENAYKKSLSFKEECIMNKWINLFNEIIK